MEPELLLERDGGLLLMTMNRPDVLNALGSSMMWEMLQALHQETAHKLRAALVAIAGDEAGR